MYASALLCVSCVNGDIRIVFDYRCSCTRRVETFLVSTTSQYVTPCDRASSIFTMPTSSQAMILRNIESDFRVPLGSSKVGSHSGLLQPAEVKSIDINELFNANCENQELKYLEAYIHGNENEIRKKLSKMLKIRGYKTVLSYNPLNDTFKWKFYKETDKKPTRPETSCGIVRDAEDQTLRAKSASAHLNRRTVSFSDKTRNDTDYQLPERIRSLGFRDPNREKESRPKSLHLSGNKKKAIENEDKTSEIVFNNYVIEHQELLNLVKETPPTRTTSDTESLEDNWDTEKYEDRCYPASHMCKILPEERPLTVCFTLPENEKYSHEEIKNLLFENFHCTIVKLQFDPLSVRAGDPIVRNRWLVDLSCRAEVDHMVRSGFKLGDVHIVIKQFDEIAHREHNKFLYLQKIREQKQQLNFPAKKAKSFPGFRKNKK